MVNPKKKKTYKTLRRFGGNGGDIFLGNSSSFFFFLPREHLAFTDTLIMPKTKSSGLFPVTFIKKFSAISQQRIFIKHVIRF